MAQICLSARTLTNIDDERKQATFSIYDAIFFILRKVKMQHEYEKSLFPVYGKVMRLIKYVNLVFVVNNYAEESES